MEIAVPYLEEMNRFEFAISKLPEVRIDLRHFFYPGVYCREMTVHIPSGAKGAYVTSKIHKTEHEFTLSVGALTVVTENDEEKFIQAPYLSTTKMWTKRAAFFHCTSVWTTTHKIGWVTGEEGNDPETLEMTLEQIEDELIEEYENPLLENHKTEIQCHLLPQAGLVIGAGTAIYSGIKFPKTTSRPNRKE